MQTERRQRWVRAARTEEVSTEGCTLARVEGHSIALVAHQGHFYAIDNRCPHMGFPLHRGSVSDGIITCHWHHARFDLASGGTFDLWADDARAYPVEIRDGEVWIDVAARGDVREHHRKRLRDGLEHGLGLVIAKAVIALLEAGEEPAVPFRIGLDFGVRYREDGWGQGLTMHSCLAGLLERLSPDERPRALYHGLSAVADDTAGNPPRFEVGPLPGSPGDLTALKRWFRRFVEVRDEEGAERCLVTAIRDGADDRALADMLFSAATDHRYLSTGHVLDFTNAAFEALDRAGWQHAEGALTSLVGGYVAATRSEESQAWRHPIDLVAITHDAFDRLDAALEAGRGHRGRWTGADDLVGILLAPDPHAIADALLEALTEGAAPEELAGVVTYAAALRIAQFPTSNEFGDWDTALHSFTFANAVHQGLRRTPTVELVRGVIDAAMTVYLNRFLNAPAAHLPAPDDTVAEPDALLGELSALLDRQQQVNQAGAMVARYLHSGGDADALMALLGSLLLREDRDFHTIQTVAAAFRGFELRRGTEAGTHFLVAAARYLAAHAPTPRSQNQTYTIARRLHRGEVLYEDA